MPPQRLSFAFQLPAYIDLVILAFKQVTSLRGFSQFRRLSSKCCPCPFYMHEAISWAATVLPRNYFKLIVLEQNPAPMRSGNYNICCYSACLAKMTVKGAEPPETGETNPERPESIYSPYICLGRFSAWRKKGAPRRLYLSKSKWGGGGG